MKLKVLYSVAFIFILILVGSVENKLFSQIKIGDNPKILNEDAILEIESNNKGLLIPRIALRSTTSPIPLKNFTKGMIVYNTSSTGNLSPGLYYCDGTSWIKANTDTNQNESWKLSGNNNITSNSFLGSITNFPLIMKTNNLERLRITEKGWVGIGTSTPQAALQVKGQLVIDSISIGNQLTDKILVANPIDGRVKYLPSATINNSIQNYSEVVASNGKNIFTTPATITDINKIFLYRNGVLISFTLNNSNSIISEIPCNQGDQIRIIQF